MNEVNLFIAQHCWCLKHYTWLNKSSFKVTDNHLITAVMMLTLFCFVWLLETWQSIRFRLQRPKLMVCWVSPWKISDTCDLLKHNYTPCPESVRTGADWSEANPCSFTACDAHIMGIRNRSFAPQKCVCCFLHLRSIWCRKQSERPSRVRPMLLHVDSHRWCAANSQRGRVQIKVWCIGVWWASFAVAATFLCIFLIIQHYELFTV